MTQYWIEKVILKKYLENAKTIVVKTQPIVIKMLKGSSEAKVLKKNADKLNKIILKYMKPEFSVLENFQMKAGLFHLYKSDMKFKKAIDSLALLNRRFIQLSNVPHAKWHISELETIFSIIDDIITKDVVFKERMFG
jgi:hypothetical protein